MIATRLSSLLALASVGLVAAQEAARFGIVSVSPTTVKAGETFTVHYNSTLARFQPVYYDAYIQGTLNTGFVLPELLLSRKDYGADQKNDFFNTTLPEYEGYFQPNASYSVWAFITYHEDPTDANSALVYGGVSTGIGIDLS